MSKFKGKKVLILSTTDNMIWQFLVPHIKYMEENGATIECACAKTGFWFDELANDGFVMHEIPISRNPLSIGNLKSFKLLKNLQKEKQYDIIYCQQPNSGVLGRSLAHKFKLPCIYVAHGFHFLKGNNPIKNFIFKSIEKCFAKKTTALITINNEDYEASKNWKAKHVYKINGIGIDVSKYQPNTKLDTEKFKNSLGFEKDDFIVTSIGELNKNKNTYQILDVIKNIENEKIKYLIVGQGPLDEQMQNFIKKHKLENRIKLAGFRKDIQDILTVSDIYIMPSHREGLSRSMMEAMSFGLPVVASRIRGNTELVGNNEGGILCEKCNKEEYKQAILKLYESEDLQKQFKKRNVEFIKNYDIKIVLRQLEEIYKEAL